MKFLDQAKIFIQSGHGGAGAVSFRREANIPRGGPDGGDGGAGGHVIAECVDSLNTLVDYRYRQHFKASRGGHGAGKNRTGGKGADVVLKLPAGTEILSEDKTTRLADLTQVGQSALLAIGGAGGRGNAHFKSSIQQAPRRAEPGEAGQELWVWLRLKLIADVGLVGLPNAGKSSFLAAVSAARPKIADYPFTTLVPQLGMVEVGGVEFAIADMPGLIADAHAGAGLGHQFLQHMERCPVLLHLVDGTANDPIANWRAIQTELTAYPQARLMDRIHITAITKADVCPAGRLADLTAKLTDAAGSPVVAISSVAHSGLNTVLHALASHIRTSRTASKSKTAAMPYDPLSPIPATTAATVPLSP